MVVHIKLESSQEYYDATIEFDRAESNHNSQKSQASQERYDAALKRYEIAREKYEQERDGLIKRAQSEVPKENKFQEQRPELIKMVGDWQWVGFIGDERVTNVYKKKKEILSRFNIERSVKIEPRVYRVENEEMPNVQ